MTIRGAAAGLLVMLAVSACSSRARVPDASPAAAPAMDAAPAATVAAPPPSFDDLEPAPAGDRADGGTVTIKLVADARRQAHVYWGRKDLGVAPLGIVRPRGSAPLDLTVLAPGCVPLHTRAFTDRDDTLSLRLYTEREAAGLPGFSPAPTPPQTTTAPAAAGKAPAASNRAPAASNRAPAASNKAPAASNKAPAASNKAPAASNKAPAASNKKEGNF